jgi:hypothetical protein
MIAALTLVNLIGFLIFTAILCLVGWGITKIPMPDFIRYIVWAVIGIFFLLMVWDLVTGAHNMPRLG